MIEPHTFGELAPRLVEQGYRPVPIIANAKRPPIDRWERYEFVPTDSEKYSQCGVGLLCGEIIGFDIDVRDARLAADIRARVEARLGKAPARIGAAPKVLLLYAVSGARFEKLTSKSYSLPGDDLSDPNYKAHRIEVLAQGQQFVSAGIHPETKRPYVWNGQGNPLEVPIGLLPSACRADFADALLIAETMLASAGTVQGKHKANFTEARGSRKGSCENPREFRDALQAIPNDGNWPRDEWRNVCFSIRTALGDDGLSDWLQWSGKSARYGADREASLAVWNSARPAITERLVYGLARDVGWVPHVAATHSQSSAEADGWPDPINPLAEIAAAPFRADELPDVISQYPMLYAQRTGIDPSICLTGALVVCAAALADQFQIAADESTHWYQQSRLWRLVIAPSGAGKSPADREMLRPLVELDKELRQQYEKALQYLSKDDPKPPRPRVIVGETTIEALSEVLKDNPRGLLIANDEFEAWFGGMDAYRKGGASRDRGEWLRTFDGGSHGIERIQRGTVYVENWGASILTATTPAALRKLTKQLPEDGLLQRFIPVIGRRQEIRAGQQDHENAPEAYAAYRETVRRLYYAHPRAHKGIVSFSFEAKARFHEWRQQNAVMQSAVGAVDSALEAHVAKYPTLLLRLCLVFHAAQCVNHEHELARDPAAFPVPIETLETAVRFLKRASQHALTLYLSREGSSDAFALARELARAILAHGYERLERRDLVQRVRAFRASNAPEQDAALRILTDLGWLRPLDGAYTKAAPAHFIVSPKLAIKFSAIAAEERERRAAVRDILASSVDERRASPKAAL